MAELTKTPARRYSMKTVLLLILLAAAAALTLWMKDLRRGTLPTVADPSQATNILLLGIGGEGHLGGNLADSIMVVSIRENKATLLSVPRDLYIDINGIRHGRVNAAHAIGEARYSDGIALMRDTLEKTLDIELHHYVRVDFQGFIDAVDAIGGVEVEFDAPLYDTHFEKQYGIIDFPAGRHHLDGRDALYVARSRKTSRRGDFDRSSRQRAILSGLKERVTELGVMTNPQTIGAIVDAAGSHLRSSLSFYDAWQMYRLSSRIENIESVGLGDVHGLLQPATIGKAQVLVPADDSLAGLRTFTRQLLES